MLQRDHGDVELVEVDGKKIYVTLKGACQGCMMEAATLGGIQQKLIEALGELVQVLPVLAHGRSKPDRFPLPRPPPPRGGRGDS
jgi:NifU-like protein